MRAFEIKPNDAICGSTYEIEASNIRTLPGLRCPKCGVWTTTGLSYPSIDIHLLDSVTVLNKSWPVTLDQYRNIVELVRPILGNRPVQPGTQLGPLHGTARGRFYEFVWLNPWVPLMTETAWRLTCNAGFPLVGAPAHLDFATMDQEPLFELEVLPHVSVSAKLLPPRCALCGRLGMRVPETIVLDSNTYDASIPLQRIVELPTVLIVNKEFADYIHDMRFQDVILKAAELV